MKKFFLLSLCLLIIPGVFATDFWVNGVAYSIIQQGYYYNNGTVAIGTIPPLLSGSYTVESAISNGISGSFTIPATVTNAGITYSVTAIGSYAFYNCKGLTALTIPNSVTSIESEAFYNCTGLLSVAIPNSVTSIEWSAFSGCTKLNSFDVATDHTKFSVIDGVLFDKAKTTILKFPIGSSSKSYVIPNTVKTISNSAFSGCTGLTSVTIPNSVTDIESYAFSGCTKLTSFDVAADHTKFSVIDGVLFNKAKTTILKFPIGGSSKSFVIPNTVKTISNSAFSGCIGLTSVTIPNSVTAIESSAFGGCSELTITCSATTPPTGTLSNMSIHNAIIIVPAGKVEAYTTAWGSSANVIYSDDTEIIVNSTVPGKLATAIFTQWNIHPSLIKNLIVTGNINDQDILYIRDNMKACYSINLEGTSLTSLPADAFKNRTLIFNLKLPKSLKTIGDNAFSGCSSIQSIDMPAAITIGGSAFSNCTRLTDLNLPAATTINSYAFSNCTGLTSVSLPAAKSVGDFTFSGCSVLTSISLPAATAINYYAFLDCSGLTSISLPAATTINSCAFLGCSGLTSISLPAATTINSYAFSGCTALSNISLPAATTIGGSAFCSYRYNHDYYYDYYAGCTALANISLPAATTIGGSAFSGCTSLTAITLGAKLTSIGVSAFSGCNSVSSITSYPLKPAVLGTDVFKGIDTKTCKLRILQEADFDAYFSAAQWGSFLQVEKIDLTGLLGDSNEDGTINIVDVVNIVNYILEKPVTKFNTLYSDMNKDGSINVIDVVQLVKMITSAPAAAPALRSASLTTGYWNMADGLFSALLPGGLRGFDITYTGSLNALPALDGFVVCPYTKNGEQHLLGYSTGAALSTATLTQLFGVSNSGGITAMTFVNDNGSPISMIQSTATGLASLTTPDKVVVENGIIHWSAGSAQVLSMQLYNANGSLVATSATGELALPAQTKGIWMLRVKTTQGNFSRKFVF